METDVLERLSVIVTSHNCAAYIGATLRSLANAIDFLRLDAGKAVSDAVEVVVVDDGSTDQTPQIIGEFLTGRTGWQLLQREKASSPSCARNTGARHASGDILFFLDGDDLYLPEHLAACSRALRDPAVDFVKSGVRLADPVHPDWHPRIEYSIVLNLAIRRRCHEAIGGFPDYHLFLRGSDGFDHVVDLYFKFEDMHYMRLICALFRGASITRPTVEYCRHPGNAYDRKYAKFCRPFAENPPATSEDHFRLRLCEIITQDKLERLAHLRTRPS